MKKFIAKHSMPFQDSIEHYMNELDMSPKEAVAHADEYYQLFRSRNEDSMRSQQDQSNKVQMQIVSHFALLSTLTITVLGFLITQTNQQITDLQKILILLIMTFEIISISFGAIDFIQTIQFHNKWARVYKRINDTAGERVVSFEINSTTQLLEIEDVELKSEKSTTKTWVTWVMVCSGLIGMTLLIILFTAYFFDLHNSL